MRYPIGRLVVVGTGLIGGSVSAAVRKRALAAHVVGVGPHAEQARALGLVDAALPLADALAGADVVVLAAPVPAIVAQMRDIGRLLPAHAVLTDAGSTKGSIVEAARAGLGARLPRFVPAHPIAGSERSGPQAADPDLFDGARLIVTPLPETDADAEAAVRGFWEALGARLVEMPVAEHDTLLAAVSHLPHAVAFALALGLSRRADAEDALRMAGGGLRDTTRIAASQAALWADILIDNRGPVDQAMRDFEAAWAELAAAMRAGDRAALEALLGRAAGWRERLQAAGPGRAGPAGPSG